MHGSTGMMGSNPDIDIQNTDQCHCRLCRLVILSQRVNFHKMRTATQNSPTLKCTRTYGYLPCRMQRPKSFDEPKKQHFLWLPWKANTEGSCTTKNHNPKATHGPRHNIKFQNGNSHWMAVVSRMNFDWLRKYARVLFVTASKMPWRRLHLPRFAFIFSEGACMRAAR